MIKKCREIKTQVSVELQNDLSVSLTKNEANLLFVFHSSKKFPFHRFINHCRAYTIAEILKWCHTYVDNSNTMWVRLLDTVVFLFEEINFTFRNYMLIKQERLFFAENEHEHNSLLKKK